MSQAKKDQGSEYYPGVDDWKQHTLKPGTLLIQLDYRSNDAIKEQQIPASNYFASGEIKVKTVNEYPSAKDLSEQVQVKPFLAAFSKEFLYQSKIAFYEVKKEINCETSEVKNNPLYGRGGTSQYFIKKKGDLLKNGSLELKAILQTTDRNHNIPLFKKAELYSMPTSELKKLISKSHEQTLLWMESSGNELEMNRAHKIRGLMQESKDLKEGKPIENAIKFDHAEVDGEAKSRGPKR